jgi:hypothetical protein
VALQSAAYYQIKFARASTGDVGSLFWRHDERGPEARSMLGVGIGLGERGRGGYEFVL